MNGRRQRVDTAYVAIGCGPFLAKKSSSRMMPDNNIQLSKNALRFVILSDIIRRTSNVRKWFIKTYRSSCSVVNYVMWSVVVKVSGRRHCIGPLKSLNVSTLFWTLSYQDDRDWCKVIKT